MRSSTSRPADGNFAECSECHQKFSRHDHLLRHERTHTLEKPHRCRYCSKQFARADLLKRHIQTHLSSPSHSTSQSVRVIRNCNRVSRACEECAATKIKCNEQKPCLRCVNKGILCRWVSKSNKQFHERHVSTQDEETTSTGQVGTATLAQLLPKSALGDSPDLQYATSETQSDSTVMRETAPSQEDISAAIPPTELPEPQVYNEDSSPSGGLNGGPMILQDPTATSPPFFLKDLLPNSEPGGGSRPRDIDWHIMDDASCAWDNFMSFDDEPEVFDDAPQGVLANYLVPTTDHSPSGEITSGDDCVGRRKTAMAACVGAKAFNTSIWHWTPRHGEFVSEEESYLSLSRGILGGDDDVAGMSPSLQGRILCDSDRDRIVSLVLTFCDQSNLASIAPSLPSLGAMERLICRFLQFQTEDPLSWFHVPTFCARGAPEEILLGMIAYGASLMPVRALQKLGTALPNILFDALRAKWNKDSTLTRNLQHLQSYAMVLKIWFWCGGRSKMELAEGFSHPIITIIRRSGALRAAVQTSLELKETDCGDKLHRKWLLWVEKESWVRLVHTMFSHDAQASMTLLINPSLSFTEMELSLPSDDGLWRAKTAEEWKLQMFSHESDRHKSLSVTDCLRSTLNSGSLGGEDRTPSTLLFTLYGLWGLIWEYRQAHHMLRVGDLFCGLDGLTLTSRFDALAKALNVLRRAVEILISKDGSHYSAQSLAELNTVLEFNSMALCTPLRTLPAFAGKYGETEAQRLYPVVEDWAQSREARQAIWHAGQVYKWAKELECQHMRDFQSVAVYHASLVFWVYGIIMGYRNERDRVSLDQPTQHLGRAILLNGALSLDTDNFIANGLGIPAIEDEASRSESPTTLVPLYNPSRTMKVGLGILRKGASQYGSVPEGGTPTFVVALVQLMSALGNAADTIGLG